MDNVIKGLATGGIGAFLILIGLILYGVYNFVSKIMEQNHDREIRYSTIIENNQKVIQALTNDIKSDMDDLKDGMKTLLKRK